MVTTATPPMKGCFCLKLVEMKCEEATVRCPGSWAANTNRWAGTGGGRGHTCCPTPVEDTSSSISREGVGDELVSGSSLLQDKTGPDGSSLLSYGHYKPGRTWTSKRWLEGFVRYQFRENTPTPPPVKVSSVPHYWNEAKEKKKRRKQKKKVREEKKVEKESRRAKRYEDKFVATESSSVGCGYPALLCGYPVLLCGYPALNCGYLALRGYLTLLCGDFTLLHGYLALLRGYHALNCGYLALRGYLTLLCGDFTLLHGYLALLRGYPALNCGYPSLVHLHQLHLPQTPG